MYKKRMSKTIVSISYEYVINSFKFYFDFIKWRNHDFGYTSNSFMYLNDGLIPFYDSYGVLSNFLRGFYS